MLSGYVPNDAVRADLVAAAKASLPGAAVVDQMEPGEGAPQGWADVAVASVRELARLEGGARGNEGCRARRAPARRRTGDGRGDPRSAARSRAGDDQAHRPDPGEGAASPAAAATLPPPAPAEAPAKEPEVGNSPAAAAAPAAGAGGRARGRGPGQSLRGSAGGPRRAGQILFRLASAELESVSFPTLDKLAEAAKSCPGMHIEVGGHASSEGSAEINQQLSLKRAQSVVAYLVHAGVDAAQLEPVGFGATRPIAPNDSSENMAKNRRIEFTVRPK